MMKKREEIAREGTALGMAVHHQGVAVPPNRGLLRLEERWAPDNTVCTALFFQRAAKGDLDTALVTALRVAVHRPMNSTPNGWV